MGYIVLLVIVGFVHEQTDWMGGDGMPGPVTNWGTRYYAGDSITAATEGQVSLVATQWDYTSSGWVEHAVESNPEIRDHAQGFMPADIDGDGIFDLVAHTADSVVWYKHDGSYGFSKNVIGPADDGGFEGPCVYPCDLDKDNDIDVLVATEGIGVGWYENPSWVYHIIDNSTGYHRVSAVDVELDGDMDVIAGDNTSGSQTTGDIYLFRDTTGTQDFSEELVADLPDNEGWRVYPQDFNNDGYADIYSVNSNTYVFLNDGAGYFTQSFHANYWTDYDFDGAWPSDINMDGDMDLLCGVHVYNPYAVGFYGLLNDGTGTNFDSLFLVGTGIGGIDYGDGAMARDMDLDGMPDIAGALYRVGWFRQDPSNPLTFILYDIGAVTYSHWMYVASLCEKCMPGMDLLVTDQGAHIVYKNQMLKAFASIGWLESSILEPGDSTYALNYFGYEACVPYDTALAFYWKAGTDSADIASEPWGSPHYVTTGMPCVVDSFALGLIDMRMFQYKAEFKGGDDIGVLYKVWLNYEYGAAGIEENQNANCKLQIAKLMFLSGRLILELSYGDKVSLEIYDIAGRMVKNVFTGMLSSGIHEFAAPEKRGIYFAVLRTSKFKESLKIIRF